MVVDLDLDTITRGDGLTEILSLEVVYLGLDTITIDTITSGGGLRSRYYH